MTAAAPLAARFDSRTATVHYSWTQYQLTTTVDGEISTVALAAMTRDDAVAYAQKARGYFNKLVGFTGMKLSMIACEYSERLTARPDHSEDGDGSPILSSERVAGVKWESSRHASRNFNMEAYKAEHACKPLRDWYRSVGC